ncbi:MAG: pilus assembly protein PilM [bacterium]|nr:pilus assembly protein PilM [bacterium]
MARIIGVDPGDTLVKIVELDGSYRKPRLVRVHSEAATPAAPRAVTVAAATRNAIDDGMKGEVRLGHPCREAVLRTLDLPFKGKDALRKVVKAEVEGEIHGYSVDDMVVDFHEIGGGLDDSTRVLVAAVPKEGLRSQLGALEAAAVEPESVDLDTMALWRAADCVGAFEPDEDDDGNPEPSALTAVLEVGSRSVKVLLVDGDQLVDMRVLRLGGASVTEEIAKRHTLPGDLAAEAVQVCSESGTDCEFEVASELPANPGASDDDGDAPLDEPVDVEMRSVTVTAAEVESVRSGFLRRLARELFRYLAATGKSNMRAVWVTGGSCRLAGVQQVLTEVFGVEPRELNVLDHVQHDLDEDDVQDLGHRLAVAVGLALGPLGGPEGFDMRQEDLAFTRGFERIKFPLTIMLMVGLLALFVFGNHQQAKLNHLHLEIGKTHVDERGKIGFFGMVNSALRGNWWKDQRNFAYERSKGKMYKWKDLEDELVSKPVHERLKIMHARLKGVADYKQKRSGIYEEVSLESGAAVLVRFAEIMQRVESELQRPLVTKISLNMKGERRSLTFHLALRGAGFRGRSEALRTELLAEFKREDSPFLEPQNTRRVWFAEKLFIDQAETKVEGSYFVVTLDIKPTFAPFGEGASGGRKK